MRKLFNIGDRVRVYCSYGTMKATVIPPDVDDKPVLDSWHEPSLHVQFDESFNIDGRATIEKRAYVHPKQCRLLRKKPERKNLSADDIARAWDQTLAKSGILCMAAASSHFKSFCGALGLKESMARRIRYRTQCFYCHRWFEAGKAWLQKVGRRWFCQCDECFERRRNERSGV